jgi:hypothetical protein
MKKGYIFTPEQKKALSLRVKNAWKRAAKYAEIIGRNKDECYNNLKLLDQYAKELKTGNPQIIDLVLNEGNWYTVYEEKNGETLKIRENNHGKNKRQKLQSEYVSRMVAQEDIARREAEARGESTEL